MKAALALAAGSAGRPGVHTEVVIEAAVSAGVVEAAVWAAGSLSNGGWTSGGLALTSQTSTFSSNVYTFDALDTANGSTATISGAFGCLVYNDTLASPK